MPRIVLCHYCKAPAKLTNGKSIYPHRRDLHKLKFWQCQPCDAYVGCHRNGDGTAPLGRLANAELRKAKSAAHRAFDPMWRDGKVKRTEAYRWLAEQLEIDVKQCHIGMFDVEMCERVIEICEG
ncbi:MAG: zinc-finger-containing protein [Pseudomonadota bacterium]|nr:zinc-finger-containing protein [Pseudomonadota bacterium]